MTRDHGALRVLHNNVGIPGAATLDIPMGRAAQPEEIAKASPARPCPSTAG